jgi:phosphinothricin acetyltransferase
MTLRLATEADAAAIHAIYAPLISTTALSFALEPPTATAIHSRIAGTRARWPWLVCDDEGVVLGYAHAAPDRANRYKTPSAYDWSAEVSVYVRTGAQRLGIGRALYTALLAVLRHQGFINVYASITLPNPASVALHRGMGFEAVGVFRGEGYKLGRWHDVSWWQARLQEPETPPSRPRGFEAVASSVACQAALERGTALLKR